MQQALQILRDTFGYSEFRLNQSDIISALIEGRDVLALMPTGGGKSLCYQIPAMVRPGVGVVVSPLIALMQDQVDALEQLGIQGAFLNSTLTPGQARAIEHRLVNGELDILYVAPERLTTPSCINLLQQVQVSLFAIDEAHCVSQWGHDFRPEYKQLEFLAEVFPDVPRIALTATADSKTRDEIIEQLRLHNAEKFINSFDRPNIRYQIQEGQNSRDQLWRFLQLHHPSDAGIVYCLSRKKVEAVADWLSNKGRIALPYHAGMRAEVRAENQQRFLRESGVIIVATIAFGMGIDKPDVRFVAHLSLPKSIEAYYQETGRAGRDGQASNAWMSYGLQDVITLRQMMEQSDAHEDYKRITQQKLEAMLGLCELSTCRRVALLDYFDEPTTKPCGNCDNCLSPPETWDATVAAQKALSCIYRSGQRFGVGYIIDVLLGKSDQRIINNGHNQLSTYGIGEELSVAEWRSLFRQLIAQGFVVSDVNRYGALQLTEKSRALLRGEQSLAARKQLKPEKTKSGRSTKKQVASIHQELFDALKALRKQLADEQGVPPYVIFHDATLVEMAESRPNQLTQIQFINGVGSRKLEKYGQAFLETILQHPLHQAVSSSVSDTVNQTLVLLSDGNSIDEIANKRELKTSTIYGHVADAIGVGLLDAAMVLDIDESDYQLISQTLLSDEQGEVGKLKRTYEMLGEEFDYNIIRCVAAAENY